MDWFKNLNATPRLMLSFGVLIAVMAGISYLGIDNLSKANSRVESLYHMDMVGSAKADGITINVATIGRLSNHAMVHAADAAIVADDKKDVLANLAEMRANLDAADKLFVNKKGLEELSIIRGALPNYEQAEAALFKELEARNIAGSMTALEATAADRKTIREASDAARASKEEHAEEQFQANIAAYQSTRNTMLAATALALALGIGLSIFLARGFSVPLGLAVEALNSVATGDLTASLDVKTNDEVGRMGKALNQALEKLRSALQEVAASAANATASSQELASAADAIATGAQEQAASLEETSASLAETSASIEETSASMEEITATVRQTADNARHANQLASSSREAAEKGQGVVSTAVAAMAEINAASAKISDIIGTIDEIAFQTNLLAVNAAVEAARAGEEGRGFAVVATEVRTLAQRSAGAAKEIKALIQDSLRKVEKGTDLVNKSGETLQSIVGSVKRVTDIVGEIAAAAGEQSTGVEQVNTALTQVSTAVGQVNTAMSQMDQVTQSNAAQTEELSGTAGSMSDQAQRLQDLVSAFKLGDRAPGPVAAPRKPSPRPKVEERPKPKGAKSVAVGKVSAPQRTGSVGTRPQPGVALVAAGRLDEDSFEEF